MRKKSAWDRFLNPATIFICSIVLIAATLFCVKCSMDYSQDNFALNGSADFQPNASSDSETKDIKDADEADEQSRATIMVTGDILMHTPVIEAGSDGTSYDFNNMFSYIKEYVSEADFAVANLETTLAGEEEGYSGFPNFNSPDELLDAVKNTGFDMLLNANNHSNDTGSAGIKRTIEVVRDKGLIALGITASSDEKKYEVVDINDIKVGMICYTYGTIESSGSLSLNALSVSNSVADNINAFDYNRLEQFYSEMENHIENMKEDGAEAIVLFIHWGQEYKTSPNKYQKAIAQKMCDLGVDVIVGGHPHVIQPVKLLTSKEDSEHTTVCLYSLGNAVSNQRAEIMSLDTGHTEDGMLFSFTFVKDSKGEVSLGEVEIIPTWVDMREENGDKAYHILPLNLEVEEWEAVLNLDSITLQDARDSYDRTMELVGEGLERIQLYLETGQLPDEESADEEETEQELSGDEQFMQNQEEDKRSEQNYTKATQSSQSQTKATQSSQSQTKATQSSQSQTKATQSSQSQTKETQSSQSQTKATQPTQSQTKENQTEQSQTKTEQTQANQSESGQAGQGQSTGEQPEVDEAE